LPRGILKKKFHVMFLNKTLYLSRASAPGIKPGKGWLVANDIGPCGVSF
jgi:hypothetical protein